MPRMICKKCGCRPDLRGCSRYEEFSSFCDATAASIVRSSQCGGMCSDQRAFPMCYELMVDGIALSTGELINNGNGNLVKILSQDSGYFKTYYKVVESGAGSSLDGNTFTFTNGKIYGPGSPATIGIQFRYELYDLDGSGPIANDDGETVRIAAISYQPLDFLGYCPSGFDPTQFYAAGYVVLSPLAELGDVFVGYVSFDPASGGLRGEQKKLSRCESDGFALTAHVIGYNESVGGPTYGTWGSPGHLSVKPTCQRLVYVEDSPEDQSAVTVTQSCVEISDSGILPNPGEDYDPANYHNPGRCAKYLACIIHVWDPDVGDFVEETATLDGTATIDPTGSPFGWSGTTDGGTGINIGIYGGAGDGSDHCCPDSFADSDCENCGDTANHPHSPSGDSCPVCWVMDIVTSYGCHITVYFRQDGESCPNGDEWLNLQTTDAETTCTVRDEPGMPGVPQTNVGAYFGSAVTFGLCNEDGTDATPSP